MDLVAALEALVNEANAALAAAQASQPTQTEDPTWTAVKQSLVNAGWTPPVPAVEQPSASTNS